MRAILAVSLVILLCPAVAMAKRAPAPVPSTAPAQSTAQAPSTAPATSSTAPTRGGDITRDEYIERAKNNAAARFDRMDVDHDGVLTADERHAYRAAHSKRRPPTPQ